MNTVILTLFMLVCGISQAKTMNPETAKIFLLTFNAGKQMYTGAGHSLLRVIDPHSRVDKIFNWGIFNFRTPNFAWRFYEGSLQYRMDEVDAKYYLRRVSAAGDRMVYSNELRFSSEQKSKIIEKIKWWQRPENKYYDYHIFEENCSTQIRDIIDFALDGQLSAFHRKQMTNKTPRDHWRETFGYFPWIALGTDLFFNSEVDHMLNEWQAMFLPFVLQANLLKTPLSLKEEQGLLAAKTQILSRSDFKRSRPINAYFWLAIIFNLPLILAIFLHRKKQGWGLRLLALSSSAWALLVTVMGVLALFTYIFTNRSYWYLSSNLLLFSPLGTLLLLAAKSWWCGRQVSQDSRAFRLLIYLGCYTALALVFTFIFKFLSILKNDNGQTLLFFVPTACLFALCVYRLGLVARTRFGEGSKNKPSHDQYAA